MAVAKARSILGDVAAEGGAPALVPYTRWVRVELVREARAGAYRTWTLREPEDAARILEPPLRREPTETFVACLLDTKHRPNAIQRAPWAPWTACRSSRDRSSPRPC